METKPKKVFHVITKSVWGGAGKYVYDLVTNLPKAEFENVVIFGGTGLLAEKLLQSNIKTISIPKLGRDVNPIVDFITLFTLISIFKKEHPDIVHVNSSKIGGLGALAGRIAGVPRIIFTCHGWPFNEDRNALSLSFIRFISWLTVLFSHVTIAVSERDLVDGQKMLGANNKVKLIHNGIKTPEFKTREEARAFIKEAVKTTGVSINDNDFVIGAIGELHKNKGYQYLIDAFDQVNRDKSANFKLVIISDGEERKKLEDKIKELGLESVISLVGFIKDAPIYLRAFDAFALTSIKEGLPYVVIEAGFAGLPTIATNVGGVREIIDDMKSGILVQTRKPDEIAQGLLHISREKEKAELYGQNLKQKVCQEFSMEKMITKTLEVYSGRI